jgi:hypothetical protein
VGRPGPHGAEPGCDGARRGVIEKCSLCVQSIQAGKLQAKKEGRPVKDGDIETACSAACGNGAIIFGDLNDKKSKVRAKATSDRSYHMLEEIGVKAQCELPREGAQRRGGSRPSRIRITTRTPCIQKQRSDNRSSWVTRPTTISPMISSAPLRTRLLAGGTSSFTIAAIIAAYGTGCILYLISKGIGAWGLNKTVDWAWDITNFVWWVGIGHAGTLISAVLLLFRQKMADGHQPFGRGDDHFRRDHGGDLPRYPHGSYLDGYWVFPCPTSSVRCG